MFFDIGTRSQPAVGVPLMVCRDYCCPSAARLLSARMASRRVQVDAALLVEVRDLDTMQAKAIMTISYGCSTRLVRQL